jgi:hypothetical protein
LIKENNAERRDAALLDGAVQSILPSYSTLTLSSGVILAVHLFMPTFFATSLIKTWVIIVLFLWLYPFVGLVLERAPSRAYLAILLGPLFILWRTWLSIRARFGKPVPWVRTPRRTEGR